MIEKTFKLFIIVLLTSSCSIESEKEIAMLKNENQKLLNEISVLKSFRDSLKVIPYIDNTTFETKLGDPYHLQLLSVIPKDIIINEVKINGETVEDPESSGLVSYNEYGPRLKFISDSSGVYNVQLLTTIKVYDGKKTSLSFPIKVVAP